MNFNDFVTGKYKNRATDTFFDFFGVSDFGGFNIFNQTDCKWFINNEHTIPSGRKEKSIVMYQEGGKDIWKGFDEFIIKNDFSVGIEMHAGHHFCYIFENEKYTKLRDDIEVDLDDWFGHNDERAYE